MNMYKPRDFVKMLSVSVKTQRWDNEDTVKAYRNPKFRKYKKSISEDRDVNQL